ncbi:MAG TPA: DinB family protein [Rubricoccaceae bacterium]|nr:DinB family protein [Rubricoccaceae bacterium]
MDAVADDLRRTVAHAAEAMLLLSDEQAARRPAPGKWSPKEIVGHLIDSASNNHARFVRAQGQDDLVFPGYDQEAWVRVQRYQEVPWPLLVALWRDFNLLLAHVIEATPEDERLQPRHPHSLHRVAWVPVPEDAPATLDYLMRDYVGHLRHHLRQILSIAL